MSGSRISRASRASPRPRDDPRCAEHRLRPLPAGARAPQRGDRARPLRRPLVGPKDRPRGAARHPERRGRESACCAPATSTCCRNMAATPTYLEKLAKDNPPIPAIKADDGDRRRHGVPPAFNHRRPPFNDAAFRNAPPPRSTATSSCRPPGTATPCAPSATSRRRSASAFARREARTDRHRRGARDAAEGGLTAWKVAGCAIPPAARRLLQPPG